jgi:hypothetical protein
MLSEKQIKLVQSILYQATNDQLETVEEYCVALRQFREVLTTKSKER